MSKLIFLSDPSIVFEGKIYNINENVIHLEFTENIPDENLLLSGINIINEHNAEVMAEFIGYETIYRVFEDAPLVIELSNDKSVWVKPKYEIKFVVNNGVLEGEDIQTIDSFENLIIPNVKTEEGYEFTGWTPEIPLEGDVEKNMTFYAVIEDKNIYFHCSGGGILEGDTKQFVEDYTELIIPTPIADENYKFVGWMPEIPKEGKIENNNTNFYAVFESNIPERLKFVEDDLTNTQLGLVENYDLTMASAEEITDCQMALVELYDLFLSQIAE